MRPNYRRWPKPLSLTLALTALLFGTLVGYSASSAMGASVLASAPAYLSEETKVMVDRCERARCAELNVQRVSFVGQESFNAFVNQALASMAWQSQTAAAPYQGLTGLTDYFRVSAKPGEQLSLKTSVVRHSPALVVLLLSQYRFDGGAHGESSDQYINWLLPDGHVVSLESMLLPGAMAAYTDALKEAHAMWIASQVKTGSIEDAEAFSQQWPFESSDNAALMVDGLRVGYPRYAIAPGFFGEPSITIPYADLRGVIKPEILSRATAVP